MAADLWSARLCLINGCISRSFRGLFHIGGSLLDFAGSVRGRCLSSLFCGIGSGMSIVLSCLFCRLGSLFCGNYGIVGLALGSLLCCSGSLLGCIDSILSFVLCCLSRVVNGLRDFAFGIWCSISSGRWCGAESVSVIAQYSQRSQLT